MGENDEGFAGTIIKDIQTITRWGRNRGGRWGGLGRRGGIGGKGRQLHLNKNKKCFFFKKRMLITIWDWIFLLKIETFII